VESPRIERFTQFPHGGLFRVPEVAGQVDGLRHLVSENDSRSLFRSPILDDVHPRLTRADEVAGQVDGLRHLVSENDSRSLFRSRSRPATRMDSRR